MQLTKRPIRVLNVISSLYSGGTEQYVMNCYRNIDRDLVQFDFLVLTKDKGVFEDEIENLGGKVYKINSFMQNPIKNFFEKRKFFKKHNYEIVEIHSPSPRRFSYSLIAKNYGAKQVIFHAHNTSNKRKNILDKMASKILHKKCDYRFTCSDLAGQYNYNNNDYTIVPNAIDLEAFKYNENVRKKIRMEFDIGNKFVVGSVGRLSEQKNFDLLIDVFSKLIEFEKNAVLLIVGEGELRNTLEQKIKDLGLEDYIILTGRRSDVANILQAMDVFVMTSLYEGFPFVSVEAQASGLPCVFSDSITKEVKLSDHVTFLPLNSNLEKWSREIIKFKSIDRKNKYILLRNQGYDIKDLTKWLTDFYLKAGSSQG